MLNRCDCFLEFLCWFVCLVFGYRVECTRMYSMNLTHRVDYGTALVAFPNSVVLPSNR